MLQINASSEPHGHEAVLPLGNTHNPTQALLLLHGRGASAEDIMQIATNSLAVSQEYIVLAPQAAGSTWYPNRFIAPKQDNQPQLHSALDKIQAMISFLSAEYNIAEDKIVLAGFSQGACLVAEYLKQFPLRYKGAAIFSGGLIGSDAEISESIQGDLYATPVYLGCDVEDAHIPENRVVNSARLLTQLGASVDLQLYEHLGHSVHPEGVATLQKYLDS